MPALRQLAIASDGRIVYRSTGKVVQASNLEIRTWQNGQQAVYRNGRLWGRLGKPTATQQRRIDKLATTRQKRARTAEDKAYRQAIEDASLTGYEEQPNGWQNARIYKEMQDTYPSVFYDENGNYLYHRPIPEVLTRDQKGNVNYGSYLQNEVENGRMTIEEANEKWDEYTNADRQRKNEMWKEAHARDEEKGYKYLSKKAGIPKTVERAMKMHGFGYGIVG